MPARTPSTEGWFDDLLEGVVVVEDGRVARLNRAAAELLGVAPASAEGLPLIAVLRDHRLERAWREATATEVTVRGRRVRAIPVRGGLALHDVEEARAAQDHARELLAVLSHELRTPLTTVRATLDALAYDDLEPEARNLLLAAAVDEADRLARLLNDLTVEVAPPRERSVSLHGTAERALGVLGPLLRERGVRVRLDLPVPTVWVDVDKLMQVLLNLLENAALHGPEDAEVMLVASEERGWARIVVRDRGRELAPADMESLFAPRARAAGASGRGAGLGLHVVRSIVERWGGHAWGTRWSAGPDHGTEFGFLVPLRRDSPPAPPI